jgi:hypothetical protein
MVHAGAGSKCEPERARSKSFSSASTSKSTCCDDRKRSRPLCRAAAKSRICCACVAVALLAGYPTFVGAAPRIHPKKARVRFLATSTLYRTTFGMNEDIYLGELTFAKREDEHVLARVINQYSNWEPPIPAAVLKSDAGMPFYLLRDASCDIPYAQMQLRTAPGDPMAVLQERLSYQPRLNHAPAPGDVLPCYRIEARERGYLTRLLFAMVP